MHWPLTWYSGSDESTRSADVSLCACATERPAWIRFACDSSAPFGRPVVPEVYMSSAGDRSSGTPAGGVSETQGSLSPSGDVGRTMARLPARATIASTRSTNSGAA